jgi:hypothetical protein
MPKECPTCGKPATGRFCSECGAPVAAEGTCAECSAPLKPGVRFCNECGAPADGTSAPPRTPPEPAGRGSGAPIAWIVTGVAIAALLLVVLIPRFQSEPSASGMAPPPAAGPMAGPQSVDLSSMSPREAADRLFDRVMRTAAQGDTADALVFVPMALNAYEAVPDMDADAHYHVATLHLLQGEASAAREAARRILDDDPGHLFGLYTAAQAEEQLGNREGAVELYRRFLESYPTEIARELPEYTAHAPAIPEMRAEAQAAVR